MGVYLDVRGMEFFLPKEHFDAALKAVKDATPIGRHVSWVRPEAVQAAGSLIEALQAWEWEPRVDKESGAIVGLVYEGEKAGDEDRLFEALAPYVESGSYVECEYEGSVMRYVFRRGKMKQVYAQLMWPGDA